MLGRRKVNMFVFTEYDDRILWTYIVQAVV